MVEVVNGGYRGCKAILNRLDEKNFSVSITIDSVSSQSLEKKNTSLIIVFFIFEL